MKKNYISPELSIAEISIVQCLCISANEEHAVKGEVLTRECQVDFSSTDSNFDF